MREPSIERLLTAFMCEEPDSCPFFETLIHKKHIEYLLDKPLSDVEHTTFGLLSPIDHLELCNRIGQDCMGTIGFAPRGLRVRGKNGAIRRMKIQGPPAQNRKSGCVSDWEVLERLLPYSYEEDLLPRLKRLEKHIDAAKATNLGVFYMSGPFLQDSHLTSGFNNFMKKIYEDRAFVKEILAFFARYYVWEAEEVSRYPIAFYYFTDNIAYNSGPFVQPRLFKELWLPWLEKIIEPFRRKKIPIVFNSDGRIDWILPELIDLGFCALNPVRSPPNNIQGIKEEYGDRLCLIGGIDLAGPLGFGTPSQVEEDVRKHIHQLAPGGGYVLASSHDVSFVPEENFVAMVRATQKYGIYPIS